MKPLKKFENHSLLADCKQAACTKSQEAGGVWAAGRSLPTPDLQGLFDSGALCCPHYSETRKQVTHQSPKTSLNFQARRGLKYPTQLLHCYNWKCFAEPSGF